MLCKYDDDDGYTHKHVAHMTNLYAYIVFMKCYAYSHQYQEIKNMRSMTMYYRMAPMFKLAIT